MAINIMLMLVMFMLAMLVMVMMMMKTYLWARIQRGDPFMTIISIVDS